jgi:hypothetical protein
VDPNATLAVIRTLVRRFIEAPSFDEDRGNELADAVNSLDEWLSRGGFPPNAWNETPRSHTF